MAMIGKVLGMNQREKKSVREIARATSLSLNRVRKCARRYRITHSTAIFRIESGDILMKMLRDLMPVIDLTDCQLLEPHPIVYLDRKQ